MQKCLFLLFRLAHIQHGKLNFHEDEAVSHTYPSKKNGPLRGLAACTRRACCVHAASILPRFHCVKPLRVYCECLPSQCELTANEFCSAAHVPRVFIMPVRACCDHNSSHCVRTATVFILPRAPCDHISSHCVHTATVFYSTASTLRSHFQDQQSDEFTSIK